MRTNNKSTTAVNFINIFNLEFNIEITQQKSRD